MQNLVSEPAEIRDRMLRQEIAEVVLDPDRWLKTPHEYLGGREPIDLLNSGDADDKQLVRNLIESIKHGIFSCNLLLVCPLLPPASSSVSVLLAH